MTSFRALLSGAAKALCARRTRGVLGAFLLLAACVLACAAGGREAGSVLLSTPLAPRGEKRVVVIQRGWGPVAISRALAEQGVLAAPWAFVLLARLDHQTSSLKAGEYELSPAHSIRSILDKIVRGDGVRVSITVPEGLRVEEIATLIAEAGLGTREKVLELARDPDFARTVGAPAPNLEGYLFPDTYSFAKGVSERTVLAAMVRGWREVFGERGEEEARRAGLDVVQAVTLASMIEKEAKAPEERPLISAVFHNRLARGMPLQSDPTVIYGIRNFDGNLTRRDLETLTPYNTYRIPGLPPGPIANPGRACLHAATHPEPVDYLYFVSRNDGTHEFSRTLEEHNRAVARYQLRRSSRSRASGAGEP